MAKAHFLYPHEADPDIFRESLAYSEAEKGFTSTLIEKDYYCSLVLQYFFSDETQLVFKGGTCLSKVHADFYRLSEDLDFIIPVAAGTTRAQRRAGIKPVKRIFEKLPSVIPGVTISEAFRGHNESRQYIGYLEYPSVIVEKMEKIQIEIGLREPLLSPSETRMASTIVINPFSGQPLLPNYTISAMALQEAYAEKVRAALTRRGPAIRDFFDLYYADSMKQLNFFDPDFLNMVKVKIDVPGNDPIDISVERKQELDRQLVGQLKPMLRPLDFDGFNLDEAFELVCKIAKALPV
ncbi:MAG: nucleotidyl transferase AbiEii/AbiGii toxin family protein [Desulfobacterales bacterium]|jgi:predicted nucleotidyltransferase component of viral defense system|nr:nucleotidyl transferase AbiEii/AbiGii toxin family protein [Desulfobacterales bacterium]